MKTQSLAVSVGEATFLDIRAQRIDRMGKNYSKCWHVWPEFLNLSTVVTQRWNYSTESCLKYCSLSYVAKECKCIDSYDRLFSKDPQIADVDRQCSQVSYDDRNCSEIVYEKIGNGSLACDCRTPCNSSEYIYVTSKSSWPSAAYTSYLATRIIRAPQYTRTKPQLHLLKVANQSDGNLQHIHQSIRENFVRLEIFYSSLRFRKISESASYDFMDLLGDFGGNIGLWLGWSVFALFEIIIFLLHGIEAILISNR